MSGSRVAVPQAHVFSVATSRSQRLVDRSNGVGNSQVAGCLADAPLKARKVHRMFRHVLRCVGGSRESLEKESVVVQRRAISCRKERVIRRINRSPFVR